MSEKNTNPIGVESKFNSWQVKVEAPRQHRSPGERLRELVWGKAARQGAYLKLEKTKGGPIERLAGVHYDERNIHFTYFQLVSSVRRGKFTALNCWIRNSLHRNSIFSSQIASRTL